MATHKLFVGRRGGSIERMHRTGGWRRTHTAVWADSGVDGHAHCSHLYAHLRIVWAQR
jgi:hypothetical protein